MITQQIHLGDRNQAALREVTPSRKPALPSQRCVTEGTEEAQRFSPHANQTLREDGDHAPSNERGKMTITAFHANGSDGSKQRNAAAATCEWARARKRAMGTGAKPCLNSRAPSSSRTEHSNHR